MSAAGRMLERLDGVRQTGPDRWIARCPAHGDKSPSLSIREADDGRVLIKCWAGCSSAEIVAAVGLRLADLFDAPPPNAAPIPARSRWDRRDAWTCLWREALLVSIAAADVARGLKLSPEDADRCALAAERLAEVASSFGPGGSA